MIRLSSRLEVGDYVFNGVVSATIKSSWNTFTDTCELVMPKRFDWDKEVKSYIKKGDLIKLYLGYDDNNVLAFQGYVSKIKASIPIKIHLEDAAYLFKKGTITLSKKDTTLKEVLNDIVPSDVTIAAQPDNVGLGYFRMSNMTPAKILNEIKKNYFQKFWFREGKLYAGLAYWNQTQKMHRFHFQKNIIRHDLEYILEEDVKVKLKIVAVNEKNERKEYEFGDPDGEARTIHFYNEKGDYSELAKEEIKRIKFTGYRGTFETFGSPFVNHGDVVELTDEDYPERNGSYLVKEVTRAFGDNGYRQVITLDIKV